MDSVWSIEILTVWTTGMLKTQGQHQLQYMYNEIMRFLYVHLIILEQCEVFTKSNNQPD